MISYYFGQKNMEKCKKLLRYGIVASIVISVVSFVTCIAGTEWIVSLFVSPEFNGTSGVFDKGISYFSSSFLIAGFNVVVGGYFTSD